MLNFQWSRFVLEFPTLRLSWQAVRNYFKHTNYKGNHRYSHVPGINWFSTMVQRLVSLFSFNSISTMWSFGTEKFTTRLISCFLFINIRSGFCLESSEFSVSQNPREFLASHSPGRILVFAYTIWKYDQISIFTQFLPDHLPTHSFPVL